MKQMNVLHFRKISDSSSMLKHAQCRTHTNAVRELLLFMNFPLKAWSSCMMRIQSCHYHSHTNSQMMWVSTPRAADQSNRKNSGIDQDMYHQYVHDLLSLHAACSFSHTNNLTIHMPTFTESEQVLVSALCFIVVDPFKALVLVLELKVHRAAVKQFVTGAIISDFDLLWRVSTASRRASHK